MFAFTHRSEIRGRGDRGGSRWGNGDRERKELPDRGGMDSGQEILFGLKPRLVLHTCTGQRDRPTQ